MFPTFYVPGVSEEIEERLALDFYAISSGPDLGGVTDPNSASVFFFYEVDELISTVGYPATFNDLAPYATKKEVRFGVGNNLRFYSLIWDKSNTFIAVGYNDSVNPIFYKSTDKGDTWTDITATLVSAGLVQKSLAVDGVTYANYRNQLNSYVPPGAFLLTIPTGPLSGDFKVVRSTTGGVSWTDESAAFQVYYPSGLTTNRHTTWIDGSIFYVGYDYSEYIYTSDGGLTWSALALPSTLLFSNAGVLTKYNNKWQARNVFNNGLSESATLSANSGDWGIKSAGLGSSLYYNLGYSKIPNQDEGLWQNLNFLGSNAGYRIENNKYKINSASNQWVFTNASGVPGTRISYQVKKPNAVKLMFIPYESVSTSTLTKSYRFSIWPVSGTPGSLAFSASTLTSTAQWTTGGFFGFALDSGNLTFNGPVTGSFLGK